MTKLEVVILVFLTGFRAALHDEIFIAVPGLLVTAGCVLKLGVDLTKNSPVLVRRFNKRLALPFLFAGILVLSFFTSVAYEASHALSLMRPAALLLFSLVFGALYFSFPHNQRDCTRAIHSLFLSLILFAWANFLLYLLGVEAQKQLHSYGNGKATLLLLLGFDTNRVMFPLASGLNSYGSILALGSAYASYSLGRTQGKIARTFYLLTIVLALVSLLLLDSRMAIACWAVGLFGTLFRLPKNTLAYLYKVVVVTVPFSSIVLLFSVVLLDSVLAGSAIARNSSDISTASNRIFIWGPVIQKVGSPKLENLIGYGYRGQIGSGVSDLNRYYFEHRLDSHETKTVHNLGLQYYLDIGILGLIIFVTLLLRVQLNPAFDLEYMAMLGLVLLLLPGFTEASPMLYQAELFFVFSCLIFYGYRRPERSLSAGL